MRGEGDVIEVYEHEDRYTHTQLSQNRFRCVFFHCLRAAPSDYACFHMIQTTDEAQDWCIALSGFVVHRDFVVWGFASRFTYTSIRGLIV